MGCFSLLLGLVVPSEVLQDLMVMTSCDGKGLETGTTEHFPLEIKPSIHYLTGLSITFQGKQPRFDLVKAPMWTIELSFIHRLQQLRITSAFVYKAVTEMT